jgi:hypothetical protein
VLAFVLTFLLEVQPNALGGITATILNSTVRSLDLQAVSHLREALCRLLDRPVDLIITNNVHSMIHARSSRNRYTVRLHHMFLQADTEVLHSLARFIKGRNKKAPAVLRDFVASNSYKIKKACPKSRRTVLRHVGRYFNLILLYNEVNRKYFKNQLDCKITWGARRRVRRQNSIKLASYSDLTKTIRVHPILDSKYVPKYVIKGIIYHEMLHHHLGVELHNGRKIAHSKKFRKRESRYHHYHKLQSWKETNLHRLLGRCKRGRW